MDWKKTIEKNREALVALVAGLIAMVGRVYLHPCGVRRTGRDPWLDPGQESLFLGLRGGSE
ncbi:MAG: hypothetical protein GY945_01985 [Rhodobacteraceae bacterium]|nr:hypothetical protein [Paracoccaceae bacterium]